LSLKKNQRIEAVGSDSSRGLTPLRRRESGKARRRGRAAASSPLELWASSDLRFWVILGF